MQVTRTRVGNIPVLVRRSGDSVRAIVLGPAPTQFSNNPDDPAGMSVDPLVDALKWASTALWLCLGPHEQAGINWS